MFSSNLVLIKVSPYTYIYGWERGLYGWDIARSFICSAHLKSPPLMFPTSTCILHIWLNQLHNHVGFPSLFFFYPGSHSARLQDYKTTRLQANIFLFSSLRPFYMLLDPLPLVEPAGRTQRLLSYFGLMSFLHSAFVLFDQSLLICANENTCEHGSKWKILLMGKLNW